VPSTYTEKSQKNAQIILKGLQFENCKTMIQEIIEYICIKARQVITVRGGS